MTGVMGRRSNRGDGDGASPQQSDNNDDGDDEEELWSDDSSFYGDAELKASYEQRAASFDPTFFWSYYEGSFEQTNTRAIISLSSGTAVKEENPQNYGRKSLQPQDEDVVTHHEAMDIDHTDSATSIKPHNPYEGDSMAKQLNESISSFLARLPPSNTATSTSTSTSTSNCSASGPWIWIANPFASNRHLYANTQRFIEQGTDLLNRFLSRKHQLEAQTRKQSTTNISRTLKTDRSKLEEAIFATARKFGVTCGKWMLFPAVERVDEVWAQVAHATVEGRLGCAAKVATDQGETIVVEEGKRERLVCVYTPDFGDRRDVRRVLLEMCRLGLVSADVDARPIYYKSDAYTCLNIVSQNEYKLRASLYSSKDVFGNLDGKWT